MKKVTHERREKILAVVGELAQQEHSDGIMVRAEPDVQAALDRTAELIAAPTMLPIFEATPQHRNVLVRVDILRPTATRH